MDILNDTVVLDIDELDIKAVVDYIDRQDDIRFEWIPSDYCAYLYCNTIDRAEQVYKDIDTIIDMICRLNNVNNS